MLCWPDYRLPCRSRRPPFFPSLAPSSFLHIHSHLAQQFTLPVVSWLAPVPSSSRTLLATSSSPPIIHSNEAGHHGSWPPSFCPDSSPPIPRPWPSLPSRSPCPHSAASPASDLNLPVSVRLLKRPCLFSSKSPLTSQHSFQLNEQVAARTHRDSPRFSSTFPHSLPAVDTSYRVVAPLSSSTSSTLQFHYIRSQALSYRTRHPKLPDREFVAVSRLGRGGRWYTVPHVL